MRCLVYFCVSYCFYFVFLFFVFLSVLKSILYFLLTIFSCSFYLFLSNTQVAYEYPAHSLIDGAHYTMEFQYNDAATNVAATAPTRTIVFAGAVTLTPTLNAPIGFIPISFGVDFYLPEDAEPGTLKLIIVSNTGSASNVQDPVTTRTIVFATSVESAGGHTFSMTDLSNAASLSQVASITPASDLVDGAIYDFTLKYEDRGGNAAAQAVQSGVGFGGANTLTPIFTLPATSSYLGQPFAYSFNLPESATAGSVKMTFTPDDANSGIVDTNDPRVILFSSAHEGVGTHTGTIGDLIFAKDQTTVTSVTPETSLVDGATYDVSIQYADALGNPVSIVS